jgi:hypothetical protein
MPLRLSRQQLLDMWRDGVGQWAVGKSQHHTFFCTWSADVLSMPACVIAQQSGAPGPAERPHTRECFSLVLSKNCLHGQHRWQGHCLVSKPTKIVMVEVPWSEEAGSRLCTLVALQDNHLGDLLVVCRAALLARRDHVEVSFRHCPNMCM